MHRRVDEWQAAMTAVFHELARVLRPGGHVAFEVGEVRGGKVKLEEAVLPVWRGAGLEPLLVVINAQQFTKTANCWGVRNNSKGTNTNRIVVFQKSEHEPRTGRIEESLLISVSVCRPSTYSCAALRLRNRTSRRPSAAW